MKGLEMTEEKYTKRRACGADDCFFFDRTTKEKPCRECLHGSKEYAFFMAKETQDNLKGVRKK